MGGVEQYSERRESDSIAFGSFDPFPDMHHLLHSPDPGRGF